MADDDDDIAKLLYFCVCIYFYSPEIQYRLEDTKKDFYLQGTLAVGVFVGTTHFTLFCVYFYLLVPSE